MEKRLGWLKTAIGLLLLAAALEGLAWRYATPHLGEIGSAIARLFGDALFWYDLRASASRWFIGWTLGALVGVTIGLLTGRLREFRFAWQGFMTLVRGVPYITLLPLSIRLFGLSEVGRVGLIAWIAATIAWLPVHEACRKLSTQLEWRARSLDVPARRWWFGILLPAIRTHLYSALQTSLMLGLIAVALVELGGVYERVGSEWWSGGIGHRLFTAWKTSEDGEMLALIVCFAVLGLLAQWGLRAATEVFVSLRRTRQRAAVRKARSAYAGMTSMGVASHEELPSLQVRGLRAGYNGKEILGGVDFTVPAGSTLVVIGRSGCGKTTFLRAIAGFRDGMYVSGTVTTAPSTPHRIGVVLQEAPVFEGHTVWHNVLFSGRFGRTPSNEDFAEAWSVLRTFGLEQVVENPAETLSGGQKQRLSVATVFLSRPTVILFDEPFANVDAITRHRLQHFFNVHVRSRVTAVFVTHDLDEALIVGDSVSVGLGPGARTLRVDRGNDVSRWERSEAYHSLRNTMLAALDAAEDLPSALL